MSLSSLPQLCSILSVYEIQVENYVPSECCKALDHLPLSCHWGIWYHANLISKLAYNPWYPLFETLCIFSLFQVLWKFMMIWMKLGGGTTQLAFVGSPFVSIKFWFFFNLHCQLSICLNLLVFEIIIITSFIKSSYFFLKFLLVSYFFEHALRWKHVKQKMRSRNSLLERSLHQVKEIPKHSVNSLAMTTLSLALTGLCHTSFLYFVILLFLILSSLSKVCDLNWHRYFAFSINVHHSNTYMPWKSKCPLFDI